MVVGAHCFHTYDQELQWGTVNLIVNVVPGMSTAGLKFALKREEVNEYFNWLDTESREAYEAADEEDQQFLILNIYCYNVPIHDLRHVWRTARALAEGTAINLTNIEFYYDESRIMASVQPDVWNIRLFLNYSVNVTLSFYFDNEDNSSPVPMCVNIGHSVERLTLGGSVKNVMLTTRKREECYEVALYGDGTVACLTARLRDLCRVSLLVTVNDFVEMARDGKVLFENVTKVAIVAMRVGESDTAKTILREWNAIGENGRVRARVMFPKLEGEITVGE